MENLTTFHECVDVASKINSLNQTEVSVGCHQGHKGDFDIVICYWGAKISERCRAELEDKRVIFSFDDHISVPGNAFTYLTELLEKTLQTEQLKDRKKWVERNAEWFEGNDSKMFALKEELDRINKLLEK